MENCTGLLQKLPLPSSFGMVSIWMYVFITFDIAPEQILMKKTRLERKSSLIIALSGQFMFSLLCPSIIIYPLIFFIFFIFLKKWGSPPISINTESIPQPNSKARTKTRHKLYLLQNSNNLLQENIVQKAWNTNTDKTTK